MPTVLRLKGYRFFFFSNEREEPPHIHVESAGRYAKFWLHPPSVVESSGFRSSEILEMRNAVIEWRVLIEERWNEHFNAPHTNP